ncbi:hypothetical protein EIMP300_54060 [Escherichia coli]|uniref:Uncharacterized protein n=1 Tax=Escherichia coli TaxID=562 RepID=A0A8S0FU78_ECOLX|nr:hypothetical protein EIMP300_54060 [Escherichia coli]
MNQDGTLDVSGGGHGIDITGDSATVDNKGGMTVTDPDSIGILIDGDKAIVNNDGDNAISNGGTGTQVNGDEATVNNNGCCSPLMVRARPARKSRVITL